MIRWGMTPLGFVAVDTDTHASVFVPRGVTPNHGNLQLAEWLLNDTNQDRGKTSAEIWDESYLLNCARLDETADE
jgi:hypothetical protein